MTNVHIVDSDIRKIARFSGLFLKQSAGQKPKAFRPADLLPLGGGDLSVPLARAGDPASKGRPPPSADRLGGDLIFRTPPSGGPAASGGRTSGGCLFCIIRTLRGLKVKFAAQIVEYKNPRGFLVADLLPLGGGDLFFRTPPCQGGPAVFDGRTSGG